MIRSNGSRKGFGPWIVAVSTLVWLATNRTGRAQDLVAGTITLDTNNHDTPPIVALVNEYTQDSWQIGTYFGLYIKNLTADGGPSYPFYISKTAPSNCLDINPDGNVSMGTSDAFAKLTIASNELFTTVRIRTTNPDFQEWDLSSGYNAFELVDHTHNNLIPFTVQSLAPTDSLFVSTNGSIGMGTSQPAVIGSTSTGGRMINVRADNGPARFVLQGSIGGELNLVHNNAPANRRNFRIRSEGGFAGFHVVNDALTGYTVYQALQIDMKTGNVGLQVAAPTNPLELKSGAHCTAGGVWTNASSRELKQDIAPLTSEQARDTVQKLQPVGYRYKSEPDEQYVGFIAEDVPDLVATKDRKSLAAMDITAVLTKVVQDQQIVIAQQKQELDRLNERETATRDRQTDLEERLARLERQLGKK